ncbi:MAG: RNA polymerase sigma factor [Actinomycetota bacterium]
MSSPTRRRRTATIGESLRMRWATPVSQHFRVFVRPGDVGTEKTTMVADMGTEQGHASRLAEVYVRSAPAGFRLAYLLTGDRALAEDLVQEAFLRFVGRLHHLRDPEAFDAYLRRTIVNPSKDTFRRRAVERSYLERRTAELREGQTDRDFAAYESMRTALLRETSRPQVWNTPCWWGVLKKPVTTRFALSQAECPQAKRGSTHSSSDLR